MAEQRKIRVGMVGGGGPNNFFGGPHRRGVMLQCRGAAAMTTRPDGGSRGRAARQQGG